MEDGPADIVEKAESNGHSTADTPIEGFERNGHVLDAEIINENADPDPEPSEASPLSLLDEQKIQKELDSIVFYIENDYNELAEKALSQLVGEYGERPEFTNLAKRIGAEIEAPTVVAETEVEVMANALGIDEIRSEFGLESADEPVDPDYETHYQMAVAYQEMGLTEEAIREFQDAIGLAGPSDGTRRFFHCANLLGHCFRQEGKPKHAVTWFSRALQAGNVSDEEQHGLWYEIASAYEADGDKENAAIYFDKIYAENVDFRDVSERVRNLIVNS